jgi:dCMP deaminase
MTLKWKQRYLRLAREVSTWSKDPSSQIGAVAIGHGGRVLSMGYNGFPMGIKDTDDRLADRPTKYKYVVHAEMNVIYNAGLNGVQLQDAHLFVWGLPVCSECAKGMIQSGIAHIVMHEQEIPEKWLESWEFSKSLFDEAGITYEFIKL